MSGNGSNMGLVASSHFICACRDGFMADANSIVSCLKDTGNTVALSAMMTLGGLAAEAFDDTLQASL